MTEKTWSGRFSTPIAESVKTYTASIPFDHRLAEFDIQGSLAHAQMLCETGLITLDDLGAIQSGMDTLLHEVRGGCFPWSLDDEDVHLNIERRLTALVGDAGKKLHTARSRNDQVATDIRLWLRHEIDRIDGALERVQLALLDLADAHAGTVMPGFTHLQVAQPVTFGHHMMAYFEMFSRDRERLKDTRSRVNRLPLGAAALAGTSYPINRERVAELLAFDGLCMNSLDAVSDRDFAIEFCAAAALIMTHVSRMSEEFILWMNPRFNFLRIGDAYCTGSSIMPQKRNPDVPELARGKTGRVTGHLMGLLTLMKSQPLAYNKDNQEDKEPLFDTADTLNNTLSILAEMLHDVHPNLESMRRAALEGFSTATDLADYLVYKGLPFRDAHEVVAQAVRLAENRQCDLSDLSLDTLKTFSSLIADDVHQVLTLEGSLASRNLPGGTAPEQVKKAAKKARLTLQR